MFKPALVAACLLSLAVTGVAEAAPAVVPAADSATPVAQTDLERLRDSATSELQVEQSGGRVQRVHGEKGRAVLRGGGGSPATVARRVLARHGAAFGVGGGSSRAVVRDTLTSATGGAVVRADQAVDGVPVLGGSVVLSLDARGDVVAVSSETSAASEPGAVRLSERDAARVARTSVAKAHSARAERLEVHGQGRFVLDPALLDLVDPRGVRQVWAFTVTGRGGLDEWVLVGADRGDVALRVDNRRSLDRAVCDNAESQSVSVDDFVPTCVEPVRAEGAGPVGQADVDSAYDALGAASAVYQRAGVDLAAVLGTPTLSAVVRWCFVEVCPLGDAFWDGEQVVIGTGHATDDVVGHEVAHGYVDATAGLLPIGQTGAVSESVSDVLGEIADQGRTGATDDDSGWILGEDLPAGAARRNLKDPTKSGQPDRMSSSAFAVADAFGDEAVHINAGVGSKTAYLISQGGTFNGRTVTGIDGADRTRARTARLVIETVKRLPSGADYADLGAALVTTCDELAAGRTGGFVTAHCGSVRAAVAATELARTPSVAGAAAPRTAHCPPGHVLDQVRMRDDDQQHDFAWTLGSLWQRTPENQTPAYAREGKSSLFAWNPDPAQGDPATSDATSAPFTVERSGTFLYFQHAYALEWAPAYGTQPEQYYDGAQVVVQKRVGFDWVDVAVPWVNGPAQTQTGTGRKVFGGDSRGYGSSRVDLSGLTGQSVRVVLRVSGDADGAFLGWWVDDVQLTECTEVPPGAVTRLAVRTGLNTAVVSWQPPVTGPPVASYQLFSHYWSKQPTLSAGARSTTIRQGLIPYTVSVYALSESLQAGPRRSFTMRNSYAVANPSTGRPRKGRAFTYTVTVTDAQSWRRVVRGMPVTLQRKVGSGPWTSISTGVTGSTGKKTWVLRQRVASSYRVLARGHLGYFGDYSNTRSVRPR